MRAQCDRVSINAPRQIDSINQKCSGQFSRGSINKINFLIIILMLSFVNLYPSFSYAKDVSARNDVCEFSSLLVSNGGNAGVDKVAEMFSWNKSVVGKVKNALSALKDYQYTDSLAYVVADFGDLSKEYFIVTSTKNNGSYYFRLRFESYENKLRLINILFKDSYKKVLDEGAFAQEPEIINC